LAAGRARSGQKSLDELAYRRRGLFIAHGVILAALLALALKIRQMLRRHPSESAFLT